MSEAPLCAFEIQVAADESVIHRVARILAPCGRGRVGPLPEGSAKGTRVAKSEVGCNSVDAHISVAKALEGSCQLAGFT